MDNRIDTFIIRDTDGFRFANSLVLGAGVQLGTSEDGLPVLAGLAGELMPSGGDDTEAIRAALARHPAPVMLGPGTFRVSGTIELNGSQGVVGRGRALTGVQSSHAGAVFQLNGTHNRVEELTISGPGAAVAQSVGVANGITSSGEPDYEEYEGGARARLRGLQIFNIQTGIVAGGDGVRISEVELSSIGANGLVITGGEQVNISGITVLYAQGTALSITGVRHLSLESVTVSNCLRGVDLNSTYGNSLRAVSVLNCTYGVRVTFTSITDLSGVRADGCQQGFLIENGSTTTLNGCGTVHGLGNSLTIRGGNFNGAGTVVNAFYAEMSTSTAPHVVVDGGAKGVMINGIHHRGSGPTYDVDVSAAGGRVLFVQHDFAVSRVNSGGKFAEL